MGDVCFVYLALYSLPCNLYLRTLLSSRCAQICLALDRVDSVPYTPNCCESAEVDAPGAPFGVDFQLVCTCNVCIVHSFGRVRRTQAYDGEWRTHDVLVSETRCRDWCIMAIPSRYFTVYVHGRPLLLPSRRSCRRKRLVDGLADRVRRRGVLTGDEDTVGDNVRLQMSPSVSVAQRSVAPCANSPPRGP